MIDLLFTIGSIYLVLLLVGFIFTGSINLIFVGLQSLFNMIISLINKKKTQISNKTPKKRKKTR